MPTPAREATVVRTLKPTAKRLLQLNEAKP